MNYWITTHWPPRDFSFHPDPFYYGVWVQDKLQHVTANMQPGDLVFKYESSTGRSLQVQKPDGIIAIQKCHRGHMGIVAIMIVESVLNGNQDTEEYTDGTNASWCKMATAKGHDTNGFVSLAQLNSLLGFGPKNRMRGFGTAHSGLKQIDKPTYDRIYAAFKSNKSVV